MIVYYTHFHKYIFTHIPADLPIYIMYPKYNTTYLSAGCKSQKLVLRARNLRNLPKSQPTYMCLILLPNIGG